MKRNTRHWIQMKNVLFMLTLLFSSWLAAQPPPVQPKSVQPKSVQPKPVQVKTIQVVNVFNDGSIETLSPSGMRQKVQLAGLQPVTFPGQLKSATVKRLQSLILGKTVQMTTVKSQRVLVSMGGMDIGSRLLNEGAALIDEANFHMLPRIVQQRLASAQQQARHLRLGIWQYQQMNRQQRFHQPLWPANRLPSPITNAPVYHPPTNN